MILMLDVRLYIITKEHQSPAHRSIIIPKSKEKVPYTRVCLHCSWPKRQVRPGREHRCGTNRAKGAENGQAQLTTHPNQYNPRGQHLPQWLSPQYTRDCCSRGEIWVCRVWLQVMELQQFSGFIASDPAVGAQGSSAVRHGKDFSFVWYRENKWVVTTVPFGHGSLQIIEKNLPISKTANVTTFHYFFFYQEKIHSPLLGYIPFYQQIKPTPCFSSIFPNLWAEGALTKNFCFGEHLRNTRTFLANYLWAIYHKREKPHEESKI